MLRFRLLFSLIAIPALIGAFAFDHHVGESAPILFLVCCLLLGLASWELTTLMRPRFGTRWVPVLIGSLGVLAAGWGRIGIDDVCCPTQIVGLLGLAFTIAVMVLFADACRRYHQPRGNLEQLTSEIFAVAYLGLLLAITAQLRWIAGADRGFLAIGSLLIAVKGGDIGAYTLGRLFGKRKMVPKLSPGKTWMGGLGAVVTAGLGCWAWLTFLPGVITPNETVPEWYWAVLYGVILGVVGLLGDLAESLIKRDLEMKDASHIVPGFGGVLDLIDSILYAGPVAVILWLILPGFA